MQHYLILVTQLLRYTVGMHHVAMISLQLNDYFLPLFASSLRFYSAVTMQFLFELLEDIIESCWAIRQALQYRYMMPEVRISSTSKPSCSSSSSITSIIVTLCRPQTSLRKCTLFLSKSSQLLPIPVPTSANTREHTSNRAIIIMLCAWQIDVS